MIVRQMLLLSAILVLGLFGLPAAVHGDDLADIQASFENEIKAFNAQSQNAFISSSHTDVVVYGTLSPEAVIGKDAFQQLIRKFFTDNEAAQFTPIYPEFRVAGTSAAAWGHYRLVNKTKAGPRETAHGRYTFTYTKTDAGWKLVALYFSPLQEPLS